MDKKLNTIATELFGKIRTQFPAIKLGDSKSQITSDPEDARFFVFDFKKQDVNLGTITISLAEESGIVILYSTDIVQGQTRGTKEKWFNFLREMREFAKQHLLNFETRNITKSNLDVRDYEHLAIQNNKGSNMSESKMYGTAKRSYQRIGEAKLIVNHSKSIDAAVSGSRTMHIESIYIENNNGERFRYPLRHLSGARAMARHVANSGNPYDKIGEHVVRLSEELMQLRKFKGYVSRN